MAEQVDAVVLKTTVRENVRVRVPLGALSDSVLGWCNRQHAWFWSKSRRFESFSQSFTTKQEPVAERTIASDRNSDGRNSCEGSNPSRLTHLRKR